MAHSPITPIVERALVRDDPDELVALLTGQVRIATLERFHAIAERRARVHAGGSSAQHELDAEMRHLEAWARSLAELASGEREDLPGR
jgi:hypothetical protein